MYDAAIDALYGKKQQQTLSGLYPDARFQTERYLRLIHRHRNLFDGKGDLFLLSAPGRSEIIGNHTDHNNGVVMACAVSLDTACAVSKRDDMRVNLASEGYEEISLSLENLKADERLAGTSKALLLGVADGMKKRGFRLGGFDAVMNSQVLSGSGLSSSAAFEVLVCYVLDVLYNGAKMDAVTRAEIGQYAENVYFRKPSGLMDQMASSFGGLVQIDFENGRPKAERLRYSFSQKGYAMVILNTRSSHDDLTEAYAEIPREMKRAAEAAGGSVLRDVPYQRFIKAIPAVRKAAGDRAVLRSLHFYQENERVLIAANALKNDDLGAFFSAVNASGLSSETQLQNIRVRNQDQPLALALALSRILLKGEGACRVHGGGFAGTTLNFVPVSKLKDFMNAMEAVFGPGCCHELDVRQQGPVRIY